MAVQGRSGRSSTGRSSSAMMGDNNVDWKSVKAFF